MYDRVMAFGMLLMATKQKEMDQYKNIKLEDIIKRDDFISVTNESNEFFGQPVCGVPVHSFYKVKMRSRRVTKYEIGVRYAYVDMFGREVPHPEYYFMIAKPWEHKYYYIVYGDYLVKRLREFDFHPESIMKVFETQKDADKYVYENKKVATQKQVDEKTKAAYENGKECGYFDAKLFKDTEEQRKKDAELIMKMTKEWYPKGF